MNVEAFFRWSLTIALIGIAGALMLSGMPVPEWVIALTSGAVGNSVRLQYTKPKE